MKEPRARITKMFLQKDEEEGSALLETRSRGELQYLGPCVVEMYAGQWNVELSNKGMHIRNLGACQIWPGGTRKKRGYS